MKPDRGVGDGGDRGSIDGNEKSRVRGGAVSCPSNIT